MKLKNKGKKIHPTPSHTKNDIVSSVLNLLPTAILALTSVLSLQDREVLAYMITRSLKTPKKTPSLKSNSHTKEIPNFDCDCFECYTCYWLKWDSSENRELIHEVIEAFEDHLASGEKANQKLTRGKKKSGRSQVVNDVSVSGSAPGRPVELENEGNAVLVEEKEMVVEMESVVNETTEVTVVEAVAVAGGGGMVAENRRGLTRKVLPDVVGLLNSRLWSLWNPNV